MKVRKAQEGWTSGVDKSDYYYNEEATPVNVKLSKHKLSTGKKASNKDESNGVPVLNALGNAWHSFWNRKIRVPITTQFGYIPLMGSTSADHIYYETTPGLTLGVTVGAAAIPLTAGSALAYGVPATIGGFLGGAGFGYLGDKAGRYIIKALGGNENAQELGGDVTGFAASIPGFSLGMRVGNLYPGVKNYVKSNYNYFRDYGLKGAPEEAGMDTYVPEPLKLHVAERVSQVEQGMQDNDLFRLTDEGTLADLLQIHWKNMPLIDSNARNGAVNMGYPSRRLHNPISYVTDYYNPSSTKPGFNYSFTAGHEPVHQYLNEYYFGTDYSGSPINYTNTKVYDLTAEGLSKPIALIKFNRGNPVGYYEPYFEYADKFKAVGTPRRVTYKYIPDTPEHRLHLRNPGELDADLWSLKYQGHINDGLLSPEAIDFLKARHNLSESDIILTIADLLSIGYGKAMK